MLNKNNFFKDFTLNLNKTKKAYQSLKTDLKNFEIPELNSYDKSYDLDFSSLTIKKFSKYNNIVIIGMGGSILGAKSIYSYFKKKIKKKIFFFDNLDENLYLNFKKLKNFKSSSAQAGPRKL